MGDVLDALHLWAKWQREWQVHAEDVLPNQELTTAETMLIGAEVKLLRAYDALVSATEKDKPPGEGGL